MATACRRFANGSSLSSIRTAVKSSFRSPPLSKSPSSPFSRTPKSDSPSLRRISFTRYHSEIACLESLLPLHSAVSVARLTSCLSTTSRSCRSLSQGFCSFGVIRLRYAARAFFIKNRDLLGQSEMELMKRETFMLFMKSLAYPFQGDDKKTRCFGVEFL